MVGGCEMNKYEKMFNREGLRLPPKIFKKDALCAGAKQILPTRFIVDGLLTGVENQGCLPYCAAYSATTFGESVLWRKTGVSVEIDPFAVYKHAKSIDGDPDGDGTRLDCALDGLFKLGYFDKGQCSIKTIGGGIFGFDEEKALFNAKMACFRFGCCVIGMNIDSSWYTPKNGVIKGGGSTEGGHAVCLTGFDEGGIVIRNSWGYEYGHKGDAYIPNSVALKQFMYGAVITNALDGLKI